MQVEQDQLLVFCLNPAPAQLNPPAAGAAAGAARVGAGATSAGVLAGTELSVVLLGLEHTAH